jgi:hypothetical protein
MMIPARRKRTRRLTLEGGFHEGLALLRVLPPGLVSGRYSTRTSSNLRAANDRSQPAAGQHDHRHDHHRNCEHHEGCEQEERHRTSNTPLIAQEFFVTHSQLTCNAAVAISLLSCAEGPVLAKLGQDSRCLNPKRGPGEMCPQRPGP